jgi:hypothetical protein
MRFDPKTARPREVEAYLRESIRRIYGDEVENKAIVTSSHGYYDIEMTVDNEIFMFKNFRKQSAKKIVKAIRAMSK